MTTVAETTVHCARCATVHPARLVRSGDRIVGEVDCAAGAAPVELSDDADLFLQLRALDVEADGRRRKPSDPLPRAQLYITEACNWRCPVCYACAGPEKAGAHLPVAEILRRATEARRSGLRRLILIGGEPTIHPDLLVIVAKLRQLGLSVSLVSNGQLLADDPGFAGRLVAAGLEHLNLQFDTFSPATMQQLRGHDDVELKQRALRHLTAAGLPYSLTVTVTRLNLPELGAIVRWAGRLPVMPSLVLFQSMVSAGRVPESLESVSREAMIREVLASEAIAGATRAHLHVVPRIPTNGLAIHPDCGALLFALRREGALVPADRALDIARFVRSLTGYRGAWTSALRGLWHFLRCLRPGFRRELCGALFDLRPGRANRRLMMIGFSSFCSPSFLDEQRLARCADHVLLATGSEPVCRHFGLHLNVEPRLPRTSP